MHAIERTLQQLTDKHAPIRKASNARKKQFKKP